MSFETLQELALWQPPPVIQLLGNHILLDETKMCLFGAPKLFKSLMAQQLGYCLATGIPWLGIPTTQCKVALLQSEIPKALFRNRMLSMSANVQLQNNRFYLDTNRGFKLDNNTHMNKLRGELQRIRPNVLILDPWYKMLSQEDNKTYAWTQDKLDNLIDEFKLSIVMVHHDTKPLTTDKGDVVVSRFPRGSRTVEGWFDSILHITGDIDTDDRVMFFECRHSTTLLKPLEFTLDRQRLWAFERP